MEINSSMSGYGRAPRAYENAPKQDIASEDATTRVDRRDNALTGSSAVLSTSLASALWAVQENQSDASTTGFEPSAFNQVENSYFEFNN
jgi:hypothetical protein